MKFDKKAMDDLLALDDAALWSRICGIAAASGIALSPTPPPSGELDRLRQMMRGCGPADIVAAMGTLSRYQKKG